MKQGSYLYARGTVRYAYQIYVFAVECPGTLVRAGSFSSGGNSSGCLAFHSLQKEAMFICTQAASGTANRAQKRPQNRAMAIQANIEMKGSMQTETTRQRRPN